MRHRAAFLGSILIVSLLAACAPKTKLISSWSAPNLQAGTVKKVFVLGVAPDSSLRRLYEDTFCASLEGMKYTAVPGYMWIQEPENLDREALEAKLRAEGVTHVLASRVVDRKTIETYVAPTTVSMGYGAPGWYGSWHSYYAVGYTTVASPGYVKTDEVYSLETNLWDVASGERIWTGLSQTWIGESPESNIKAVISQVAYELRSKKIL